MSALSGSETVLIAVHLQGDIVGEGTAFGGLFYPEVAANNIVETCNAVMKKVRSAGGLVIPTRVAWAPDYSDMDASLPLLQMVVGAGCLKEGSEGAAIVPGIEVSDKDMVLTHKRTGPFTQTDLEKQLRDRGIKNVVVCGVATNASVESTVRSAADLGFNTFVLSDATSAADAASRDASLGSMGLFAQVITTGELEELLS